MATQSFTGVDGAYGSYKDQRFFGSLNGLRCLCIALVLWHHSPFIELIDSPPLLARRGFVGVDFFFVLSGFLITTLLLREETRNGRFSLKGFYRRRILRIVPIYFLLVAAVSAYFIWGKGQVEYAPMVPYYFLFLSNFLKGDIPLLAPTWSLSSEEQFYLLWPLLMLVLPAHRTLRIGALCVGIGVCVAMQLGLSPVGPVETAHARFSFPGSSYEALLIGALLALILDSRAGYRGLYRLFGDRWAPVGLFVALFVALAVLPETLAGWPDLVMHVLMALCLASLVLREDHVLAPALSWAPVRRIGEISYGIYLYHLIARHLSVELVPQLGGVMQTAVFVALSVVIAEASFRTIERYFLSMKH